jgi:hypothetical protein
MRQQWVLFPQKENLKPQRTLIEASRHLWSFSVFLCLCGKRTDASGKMICLTPADLSRR